MFVSVFTQLALHMPRTSTIPNRHAHKHSRNSVVHSATQSLRQCPDELCTWSTMSTFLAISNLERLQAPEPKRVLMIGQCMIWQAILKSWPGYLTTRPPHTTQLLHQLASSLNSCRSREDLHDFELLSRPTLSQDVEWINRSHTELWPLGRIRTRVPFVCPTLAVWLGCHLHNLKFRIELRKDLNLSGRLQVESSFGNVSKWIRSRTGNRINTLPNWQLQLLI